MESTTASSLTLKAPPKKVKEYPCHACKDLYNHHDLLQSKRTKWLKCNEDEVKIGQWICFEC